jgi:protein-disulfide isomerase
MSTSARRRKAARQQALKRQQQTTVLIGVVIVVVVAVVLVVISNISPRVPNSDAYADIERGVSEEGLPQLGSHDAPVVIHEYASFACSHCLEFHSDQFPQLLEDLRGGQVRFVYVPVDLSQDTVQTNAAAFCALDQNRFWEFYDTMFAWVAQFGGNAFAQSRLVAGAEAMGLDMDAFNTCLAAPETLSRVEAADQLFNNLMSQYSQVTGTPTLTFNGVPPDFGSGGPSIDYIRQRIAELSSQSTGGAG